jgi:hypothetical protein
MSKCSTEDKINHSSMRTPISGAKKSGYSVHTVHQDYFDQEAQSFADSFWCHITLSGLIYYLWGMWFIIPLGLALRSAWLSTKNSRYSELLRSGRWPFENPNNGQNPPNKSVCSYAATIIILSIWFFVWFLG